MSTNSDHETLEELVAAAKLAERRRIIGILLNAYGRYKLAGHESVTLALDELVTEIEHP